MNHINVYLISCCQTVFPYHLYLEVVHLYPNEWSFLFCTCKNLRGRMVQVCWYSSKPFSKLCLFSYFSVTEKGEARNGISRLWLNFACLTFQITKFISTSTQLSTVYRPSEFSIRLLNRVIILMFHFETSKMKGTVHNHFKISFILLKQWDFDWRREK